MSKTIRRSMVAAFVALLIALCCVFVALWAVPAARADEGDVSETPTTQETQFHETEDCDSTATNEAAVYDAAGTLKQEYGTLADAIAAAVDGETVKVLKCFDLSAKLNIAAATANREITVDFDGHTVNCTNSSASIELVRRSAEDGVKDVVRFINGKIVNTYLSGSTALVAPKHYRTAYFKNMELECGTYCVSSQSVAGKLVGFTYILSGTYRTAGNNSPAYTSSINKDIFKYVEKGDTVRFERINTTSSMSKYASSEFASFELPVGYMIDIDLDGTSLWVTKDDYKYFIGDDDVKYTTIAAAIEAGNTEVKLSRSVPAIGLNEEFEEFPLEFEIPEGKSITLDLNISTFSAKIINNGNLILTGPNNVTPPAESVFDGKVENKGGGTTTAVRMFTLMGDAKEYILDNTIALRDDMYILLTGDGGYEIQESKLEINGRKYSSYTAAIKAGVRDITISRNDAWIRKDTEFDWDTFEDETVAWYWNENITVDIGNSELTITLDGVQLRGMGSSDGENMTMNVVSGKVNIIGKNGASLRAPADNSSYNPEHIALAYTIQNAGELTVEGVEIAGGVYKKRNNDGTTSVLLDYSVVQGALIHNTGKLVIKNSTVKNTLQDSREGIELGSGIDITDGSLELDNVYINTVGYGVKASAGASVNIYGGTNIPGPLSFGAVVAENGANIVLGKSTLYSPVDLTAYVDKDLCVKKTGNTYSVDEHNWGEQPEWKWNEDNNLICDAEFTCAFGGEKVTLPATVTFEAPANPCENGAVTKYTAAVAFNGATLSTTKDVASDGTHSYAIEITQPPQKTTYTAFEQFNTNGMFVRRYCYLCNKETAVITDYTIVYENGDCLHVGDSKVTLSHVYEGKTYTYDVLVTVNPFESQIKWQYSRNNESWTDIDESTVMTYDGEDWFIRAAYLKADDSYGYISAEKLLNAGTFERAVDISEYTDYLFNADGLSISLTVEPKKIKLSDKDTLGFELTSHNADLWNGPVYIYTTAEGNKYPSYSLLDTENDSQYQGWTFDETATVLYSVARYRGADTQLVIGVKAYDGMKFTVVIDQTSDHTATAVGVYTVKAVLTALDNYAFESNFASDIYNRGLTFEISSDNKTATVTKVWYVVQMDNYLVKTAGGEAEYDIPDWNYGQTLSISAPALAIGTDTSGITYTLRSGSQTIAESFNNDRFEYYINNSMFVGSYRLEITVPTMSVDGIMYKGATFAYEFAVKPVDIAFNMTFDEATGYGNYEWEYSSTNRETFFDAFVADISRAGVLTFNSVDNKGYWKSLVDSDASYTGYTIAYNFARLNTDLYYTANNNDLLTAIAGGANGTYTVYFDVRANNHEDLIATGASRYGFFFTVTVYETLDVPTVSSAGLVYTGNKVLPDIAEKAEYEVVWSAEDDYVSGGKHSVSFKLYDTVHYRWANADGDTVSVEFTVGKATNEWLRNLTFVGWAFETFDKNLNRIRAVPTFLDAGEKVVFKLTDKDGKDIADLTDIAVDDNGIVTDPKAIAALNALTVGDYKLYVSIRETVNYKELKGNIDVRILPTSNKWADGEDDLILPSWIVGSYDPEVNIISVKPEHGTANIIITDLDGTEYYNSTTGLNKLNECAIGKYLLTAWVDGDDNFAPLAKRSFTIEVFKKAGMPWWGTLLIVIGALGIAALILWILHEKGILQMLTGKIILAMRMRATVDATIAAVRANKVAAKSKESVAAAEQRDRLEAMNKAREENKNKTPEERAAELEQKAEEEHARAQALAARADKIKDRAKRLRQKAETAEVENANAEAAEPETVNADDPDAE